MSKFISSVLTAFYLLSPSSVMAQITVDIKQKEGQGIPVKFGSTPNAEGIVQTIILNVITLFFAVGGIGVVIYFIWGAVDWIMSGGDKEKIASARKKMTNSLIGLLLLSLSFAIIRVVGAIAGFDPLGNLQLPGLGSRN